MANACARHLIPLLRPFGDAGKEELLLRASVLKKPGGGEVAAATAAAAAKACARRPGFADAFASGLLRSSACVRGTAARRCSSLSNSKGSSSSAPLLTWLQQLQADGAPVGRRRAATGATMLFRGPEAAAAQARVFVRPPAAGVAASTLSYNAGFTARRLLSSASTAAAGAASASSAAGTAAPDEEEAYHAGLVHTEFTNELHISKETPIIPIFRVLNYEGKLVDGWQAPFSNEDVIDVYQFMVKLSIWDNLFYNIQRQGRISFYIQNQGEEALQVGVGKALDPADHLFCQYRELGVLLLHGFTEDEVLEQLFARKGDECKGRQMPISYSKRAINLHTICTPLTTQVPHAAGAGYAFRVQGTNHAAITFFGEGAASEGDFHAAMNFAATLKSQTLFACRNNGYAISTPVKDQYAGDGIAIRGIAYGMKTVRVDGNDVFACFIAAKKARELVVEEREPVLMEFMTYRVGHHSTSDDSAQYRPQGELEKWSNSGVNPIARLRRYLDINNLWTEEQDEELRKDARAYMLQKLRNVEKHKRWPVVPGIFDDVYDKEPWHLAEQREEFASFLQRNKQFYPQLKEFESIQ